MVKKQFCYSFLLDFHWLCIKPNRLCSYFILTTTLRRFFYVWAPYKLSFKLEFSGIKFLDTKLPESREDWNLGLVKKGGKKERNPAVASLLSLYGPSPIGTTGSNQAASGPECWDKRPKIIFFPSRQNFRWKKTDISQDTQMNTSPDNANFSVPKVVYTHKINCGAKLQGELWLP